MSRFDSLKADLQAQSIAATNQRTQDFYTAFLKAVRVAHRKALETGEDQPIEEITVYGLTLWVKASQVRT